MPITDVTTTYFDKNEKPIKKIVEPWEPKEHAIKVQMIENGKTDDRAIKAIKQKRVHISFGWKCGY